MTGPTLAPTEADAPPGSRPLELAEPALMLVTVAAAWSLVRLFDQTSFLPKLLAVTVLAHLGAAVTRRAKLNGFLRASLFLGGGLALLTALYLPETAVAGFIPLPETFREADFLLRDGWQQFSAVRAPAPLLPGFLLSAAAAIWVAAWLADWIAFRAWAGVEAIIPPAALFAFSALLGTQDDQVVLSLFFIAAALVFVVLHRAARDGLGSFWVANRGAAGSRALAAWGLPVVVLALLAGAVVGPRLPGAEEPAVWAWRDIGKGTNRQQLASPLVDLKPRLVDQSDEVLFTVRADRRAYWRLMSLEKFDGQEWRSSGQFGEAGGDLPHRNQPDLPTTTNAQSYSIRSPGQVWVPAAFEVAEVEDASTPLRWDPGAAALIVDTDDGQRNVDGITYQLVSESPAIGRAEVDAAPGSVPQDIAEQYLGLPDNLNPEVQAEARRVTEGAASPADQARALEAYFRGGRFTYSLEPAAGQGSDDLTRFLFDSREGYCEQFSAAYAAMARSIGLPARVAVGYTPGDYDEATGVYSVRGRNAHAWPEVWLEGVGWVAFEPTPGRGLPDAPWSATQPGDDVSSQGAAPAPAPAPVPAPGPGAGTEPAPTTAPGPGGAPNPPPAPPATPPPLPGSASPAGTDGLSGWARLLVAAVIVVTAVSLVVVAVPLLRRRRRARRRTAAAGDPSARTRLAWMEATEAVARLGVKPDRAATAAEAVARARPALTAPPRRAPDAGGDSSAGARLGHLADLGTIAQWSAEPLPEPMATEAEGHRDAVLAAVDARQTPAGRLLATLDPRPLLPERPARPARLGPRPA